MEERVFKDRQEAGKILAKKLKKYAAKNPYVLALPRGGVVVGFEIAKALKAPLDVLIVRKIGAVFEPELAIGAIAEGNVQVLGNEVISSKEISRQEIQKVINLEKLEIKRRQYLYRQDRTLPDMQGKTLIIVDDGLATGYTALAAIKSAKKLHPRKLVFAAPVCAEDSISKIKNKVDDFVCLLSPPDMGAIGEYYLDFRQVTDEQVISLLSAAKSFRT